MFGVCCMLCWCVVFGGFGACSLLVGLRCVMCVDCCLLRVFLLCVVILVLVVRCLKFVVDRLSVAARCQLFVLYCCLRFFVGCVVLGVRRLMIVVCCLLMVGCWLLVVGCCLYPLNVDFRMLLAA